MEIRGTYGIVLLFAELLVLLAMACINFPIELVRLFNIKIQMIIVILYFKHV